MTEFPFQLSIKNTSSKNQKELLSCTVLLRAIPGRREIYGASWNNKGVIAKIFSHKVFSRRHLKREWEGLSKLTMLELNSPKPLFFGKTEDGRWAVIVEKIAASQTVLEVFQKTTETDKKLDLLIAVCKELAKQHIKGVSQKDLHLGNFLLVNEKVFLLDPGQMRFLHSEVGKKNGISQLAMLANYLPESDTESTEKLCQKYYNYRGWQFGKSDKTLFQKQLAIHKKRSIRKGLKKYLRTSKRSLRIKSRKYLAVLDKSFCLGAEPFSLMEQIDELMDKGKVFKDGNTCYVSRFTWNNKDLVVKRYNHKGFIHSLRHTIKGSRARYGWLHAHRLRMLQIPTPKPLAYIEHRKYKLVWQSYLVTEYVEGQKLYYFLQDSNITKEQRSTVTQQIMKLLDKLGKHRITHGDLKPSNILVTDNGPVITDLDGMKVHRCKWLYRIRRAADIARIPAMNSE